MLILSAEKNRDKHTEKRRKRSGQIHEHKLEYRTEQNTYNSVAHLVTFLPSFKRSGRIPVVVDFVASGSRFKVYPNSLLLIIIDFADRFSFLNKTSNSL